MNSFVPVENFSQGLCKVDIPELGPPIRGKVRENWIIDHGDSEYRLLVTTDRQAVHACPVCTVPGKGRISNLISSFWFEQTKDIVPNHVVSVLHPNVLLARQAKTALPVEVVVRRFMAKSASQTSVFYNYAQKGRRKIYGIDFPDGLKANEEFPMGTIITPTTKALDGHDQELTDAAAKRLVDGKTKKGVWREVKIAAELIFERARIYCLRRGVLLADTKFEFGLDEKGNLMLMDEVLTPECSRFWFLESYHKRLEEGLNPDPNKDVLVNHLDNQGFTGSGRVPLIDGSIITELAETHASTYRMIRGSDLPSADSSEETIRKTALNYLADIKSNSKFRLKKSKTFL